MEDKLTMLAPLFLEAEDHEAHLSALYIKTKFSVSILLGSLEHELKKMHVLLYNRKALCNKNDRTTDNKNKE